MNTRLVRMYTMISLLALAIAASAGVLLRFGLYQGMPAWAQNYANVRHAHSHLMYFGWGTLGIMALIWHLLPRYTGRSPSPAVHWQMAATAFVALLSFPAFWINGYGITQIGSLALPLGSMVSGLNALTWLIFITLYVRATSSLGERPLPVQLWDWALVLLLLATGGALGLMAMVFVDHPSFFLQQAFLHLFLDLFAVGWFVLALLGILWAWIGQRTDLPRWLPTQSLAICLAPTFVLGIAPALVPPPIVWLGLTANAAAGILLAIHLWMLWQQSRHLSGLVRFGLGTLAIHALIALLLLWPGLWQWSSGTQLRIFFLHNLLLGGMSSILLGLVIARWHTAHHLQMWGEIIWIGSVGVILVALLGLGLAGILPVPALIWFRLAAWSSIPVAGIALAALVVGLRPDKRGDQTTDPSMTPEKIIYSTQNRV